MSRLPPVPPASQPAYGPDAVPKNFATALPQFQHHEADLLRGHQQQIGTAQSAADESWVDGPFAGDDLGGAVSLKRGPDLSELVPLIVFGAIVAAIAWLAGKRR